ncbi:hypothetical protein GUJ93_ZPchr0008g12681 [Zizania palustris]|uniref:TF-B3 domain-containing protein n=1 Tax=Zizania palustris TaxID=103762 RepID=A0A8J5RPB5_ZIZPA|nr:hypothetical protein GUJ93_ZPchr0008g12681 [Zizania palustris]
MRTPEIAFRLQLIDQEDSRVFWFSGGNHFSLSVVFWCGHEQSRSKAIPDEFVQHFRGIIPRAIKLQSRNGCIFDVQITKNLGRLSLKSGWKAFV